MARTVEGLTLISKAIFNIAQCLVNFAKAFLHQIVGHCFRRNVQKSRKMEQETAITGNELKVCIDLWGQPSSFAAFLFIFS